MSRKAAVYSNKELCGFLEKTDKGDYVFSYHEAYFQNPNTYGISLTLPKTQQEFRSPSLFPFFFGLLSEGANKATQCRALKIDENDYFSLLLKTAHTDTIGAITVKPIEK
ncbi:HipA N-terminal domain-containing protein [Flexithrix dorotheae]|uniref:HipA N-terminal domain-containing protein n=1 Tax=Flexithrix dorotheae TaxID=70993 RepID=UPI0003677489|nr:HipA N-terminal domain-containing protein [Flexithrix dorotheae]